MKTFLYTWDADFFLLHIQLDNDYGYAYSVSVHREYQGKGIITETVNIPEGAKSHRFMVSRTHPKEVRFLIDYPDEAVLEAFKLDDRAYYPTESFFRG
jgi:hypothetical protein